MNTKAILKRTLVSEVMRLANLYATARIRRHVVHAGLNGTSAETKEGTSQRVEKAEVELRNYAEGLAMLSENNAVAMAYERKQKTIAAVGVNFAYTWYGMTAKEQGLVLASLPSGMTMADKVLEWATSFYETHDDASEDFYQSQLQLYTDSKMHEFVGDILKPKGA